MSYQILLSPIISGLLAQIIKLLIRSNGQAFSLKNLMAYSGMPSGHTAMIVSLTAIIGLTQGFSSPLFALSAVLAIIIIRDALGFRRYLGQHGKMLNALVRDLKKDDLLDAHYPRLLERIGHTPAQVLAGGALGLAVSLIIHLV